MSLRRPIWSSQRFPGGSGLWRGGLWTSERNIRAPTDPDAAWILLTGAWNDSGAWDDSEVWNDG